MMNEGKSMRWLPAIVLFGLGTAVLLISQFWLIVHFLWSASIWADVTLWALGIAAVLMGYFLLCWSRRRKRFSKVGEHLYRLVMTFLTLTVLGVGVVTPSFFVLSDKQGGVLPDTVPEQHIPVEWAITRSAHPGTMTEIHYTTPIYDESGSDTGVTAEKRLRIYLPADYTLEKKYDVLYMLNFDEDLYFDGGREWSVMRNFFDHMMEEERIRPMILVICATGNHTSDVVNEATQLSFQYELRQVILPLVEGTFSTYAGGTDEAALEASRNHRWVTGFSNGGYATMYTFLRSLDYFQYFIPTGGSLFDNATVPQRLLDAVSFWDGKYGPADYVLAFGTGGRDLSYPGLVEQYEGLCALESPAFVPDPTLTSGNLALQIGENYRHGAEAMMSYLYVYLPMMQAGASD